MPSDPQWFVATEEGAGFIYPLGAPITETGNFLAVKNLWIYTEGFRGGAARGRGKLGAKEGSEPQRPEREREDQSERERSGCKV